MSFYGADVEALRRLAQQFDAAASRLEGTRAVVAGRTQLRAWTGPVAVRFRGQWSSEYGPRLLQAAESLRRASAELRSNADEQASASSATGSEGGRSSVKACIEAAQGTPDVRIEEGRYGSQTTLRNRWGDSYGGTWSHDETARGGLHGDVDGGAGYDDASHSASAHVKVDGQAGWEVQESVRYENGLLEASGEGSGFAGVRGEGEAVASLGPDGAKAQVGVNAFAGAEVSANAAVDYGGVGAGAEASLMAGVGAQAEAKAQASMDEISVEAGLGLSLGVGASMHFSISIKPKEVLSSILGLFGH